MLAGTEHPQPLAIAAPLGLAAEDGVEVPGALPAGDDRLPRRGQLLAGRLHEDLQRRSVEPAAEGQPPDRLRVERARNAPPGLQVRGRVLVRLDVDGRRTA